MAYVGPDASTCPDGTEDFPVNQMTGMAEVSAEAQLSDELARILFDST